MTTIYDIAKVTGFSAPTISKALNGTGHLLEETRKLILEKAQEMGYEPNSAARSLATKRTYLIGIIYDDPSMQRGFRHPLFARILNKFKESVENSGYDIIFLSCHTKLSYRAHAAFRSVEGIVIINGESVLHSELEELGKIGIPCVSTNGVIPGICTIIGDNVASGYKAAQYLVSKGHRKIGFLSAPGDDFIMSAQERYEGFCKYMRENGISVDPTYFEKCDSWRVESGKKGFEALYKRHPDMTAVFAVSDLFALGVMEYAEQNGIKIPEQLSIIGFDDDLIANYTSPRLTTFRQDADGIATLAADLLLEHIVGLPVPERLIRLPTQFIERDSVISI